MDCELLLLSQTVQLTDLVLEVLVDLLHLLTIDLHLQFLSSSWDTE
jgi:hypothetical protein